MAKNNKKKTEAVAKTEKPAPVAQPEVKMPDFLDAEGQLKKLKGSDFPKSKAGKMAFCDYNITKWTMKKKNIETGMDPAAKAKKRREKLLKQLATLDETIGEMEKTDKENAKTDKENAKTDKENAKK